MYKQFILQHTACSLFVRGARMIFGTKATISTRSGQQVDKNDCVAVAAVFQRDFIRFGECQRKHQQVLEFELYRWSVRAKRLEGLTQSLA